MKLWPFSRKATSMDSPVLHELLGKVFGGGPTKSGASVNETTALQVGVVLACVRVISEGIAQVPLKVYRSQDRKRDPATDHPLYSLLHRKPNPWMSSFELRETIGMHAVLTGHAVCFLNRVGREGRIAEIIPFEPGRVTVKRADDWTLTYHVRGASGDVKVFPAEAIWHLRGPSWDGYTGLEIVRLAREAIGLAMVTEETQARLHQHGLQPAGLYSVENKLSKEQYTDLRAWIEKEHGGAANTGRVMLLDNGAKFTPLVRSGVDAQHLETRRFQVEEMCRPFRVLPIMIGFGGDKALTFASAEQMFLAHVVHTLSPWYERIEQSINVQLLTDADLKAGYYAKHTAAGLLRGALKDTAEYLHKLVLDGILTRNEARELLEFNPIDGLDVPLTPANTLVGTEPTPTA